MKKLNLLFIVSKTRIRKDGKVPLFCRLTYLDGNSSDIDHPIPI